jgi:hypothetical protein
MKSNGSSLSAKRNSIFLLTLRRDLPATRILFFWSERILTKGSVCSKFGELESVLLDHSIMQVPEILLRELFVMMD